MKKLLTLFLFITTLLGAQGLSIPGNGGVQFKRARAVALPQNGLVFELRWENYVAATRTWTDSGPLGNSPVAEAGAKEPQIRSDSLWFDGGWTCIGFPIGMNLSLPEYTFVMIASTTFNGVDNNMFVVKPNTTTGRLGMIGTEFFHAAGAGNYYYGDSSHDGQFVTHLCVAKTGSPGRAWINSTLYTDSGNATVGLTGCYPLIGAYTGSPLYPARMNVKFCALWNRVLTDAEIASVQAILASRYP